MAKGRNGLTPAELEAFRKWHLERERRKWLRERLTIWGYHLGRTMPIIWATMEVLQIVARLLGLSEPGGGHQ